MTTTTSGFYIGTGVILLVGGLSYLIKSNWEQKSSASYSPSYSQYGGTRRKRRSTQYTKKRRT